ncbi:MAG: hypothetical protein ACKPKO_13515, partial [Candidatus Fonsibacter sp.]
GGREQKTFDEIFTPDGRNIPYLDLGPSTFAEYLQRAYWNNLVPSEDTGYVDPGWLRASPSVDESLLVDSSGRQHIVCETAAYVRSDEELRGISVCDLRHCLGLPVGRAPYTQHSDEHAVARTVSGILRHSGSVIPPDGKCPSLYRGLGLEIDTGGWFMVIDVINAFNRHVRGSGSRRARMPYLSLEYLANVAPSGTEDKTKLRW